jgi:hypothetical protein
MGSGAHSGASRARVSRTGVGTVIGAARSRVGEAARSRIGEENEACEDEVEVEDGAR